MIPPVRTWRVRWFKGKLLLAQVRVLAPTKLLARLAVREELFNYYGTSGVALWRVIYDADRTSYYMERKH